MPLSELLYRLSKGKFDSSSQEKNLATSCSTDLSSVPENDFVELVWENGQVQSSKGRKVSNSNSIQSQNNKIRDCKDVGNGTGNVKMGRFGAMQGGVLDDVPMPVQSVEMGGLSQDDDMVPWLNYSIDESLQQDYDHEFFTELSGVTVNEHTQNSFAPLDKRSNANQSVRDSHTVSVHSSSSLEQGHIPPRVSSTRDGDAARPRTTANQLYSSSSQQCQTSFPYFRSRASTANDGESAKSSAHLPPSGSGFPIVRAQKQVSALPTSSPSLMNFSHFSRPVALAKANLQNSGTRVGSVPPTIEKIGSKDKDSVASSSNPIKTSLVDTFNGLRKEMSSLNHPVVISSKVDTKPSAHKATEDTLPAKQTEAVYQEDNSKNDKYHGQFAESETRGLTDGEKTAEPIIAASSVCSGNSVERVSDELTHNLKRLHRDTEESEGPSEDVEEESIGGKKPTPARAGNRSKRTRAAEVHNLSERRRRDRINEKMRALQELIPNCNKVDKASMLDEAIEYLKTLQLQVQIMSMGAGLYMPSMMMPHGMSHMHAAHMAQFSPMNVGMGMGMGMGFGMGMPEMIGGSSSCPMIQVPPMHGAHFPGPPISGPSALHGVGGSNLPIFGQGHPMQYPCAPLMPMSGGPFLRTPTAMNAGGVAGPMDNLNTSPGSSSKDSVQVVNSQVMQNGGASSSLNETSTQCQARNECFEQSALVQSSVQGSEVADNGPPKSSDGSENPPSRPSGCS